MLMMLFSVLSLKIESDRKSAMTIMKYKKSWLANIPLKKLLVFPERSSQYVMSLTTSLLRPILLTLLRNARAANVPIAATTWYLVSDEKKIPIAEYARISRYSPNNATTTIL